MTSAVGGGSNNTNIPGNGYDPRDPELQGDGGGHVGATDGAAAAQGTQGPGQTHAAQGTSNVSPTDDFEVGGPIPKKNDKPIEPPLLPPDVSAPEHAPDSAAVLADNIEDAMGPLLELANMSADRLATLFMALNILNPENDPKVQDALDEARTNLTQLAIEEAKRAIDNYKEQIEEAEQRASIFKALTIVFGMLTPVGFLLHKVLPKNEVTGVIFGVLNPVALFLDLFGAQEAQADVEMAKKELELAEDRLQRVSFLADQLLGGPTRKKANERWLEEDAEKVRWETNNVGEDGVPLKTVANKLQNAMTKVMEALQKIGAEEGVAAMLQAAPELIHQAVSEVFTELNLKDGDLAAQELTDLLVAMMTQNASGDVSATQVAGPMTILIGEELDPETPPLDPDAPEGTKAFTMASFEALQALRDYARNAQGVQGGQTYIS